LRRRLAWSWAREGGGREARADFRKVLRPSEGRKGGRVNLANQFLGGAGFVALLDRIGGGKEGKSANVCSEIFPAFLRRGKKGKGNHDGPFLPKRSNFHGSLKGGEERGGGKRGDSASAARLHASSTACDNISRKKKEENCRPPSLMTPEKEGKKEGKKKNSIRRTRPLTKAGLAAKGGIASREEKKKEGEEVLADDAGSRKGWKKRGRRKGEGSRKELYSDYTINNFDRRKGGEKVHPLFPSLGKGRREGVTLHLPSSLASLSHRKKEKKGGRTTCSF